MSGILICVDLFLVRWYLRRFAPADVVQNYTGAKSGAILLGVVCLASMVVAGLLDDTVDWERFAVAIPLYIVSAILHVKAFQDNPFFRPELLMPPLRITTGSYGWLDHPGYFAFSLRFLAFAYFINTPVSLSVFCIYALFLAVRAMRENQILRGL